MRKFFKMACFFVCLILLAYGVRLYFGDFNTAATYLKDAFVNIKKTTDIKNDSAFNANYEFLSGDFETSFKNNEITSVSFNVGGDSISIFTTEADEFELKINNIDKYQCYVENGCLYFISTSSGLFDLKDEGKVSLSIPKTKVLDSFTLLAGACGGEINGINATVFSIESDAANLEGDNLTFDNASIYSNCGKIMLTGTNRSNLEVKCNACVAEINLYGRYSDYNYTYEAFTGEITVDGEDIGTYLANQGKADLNNTDLEMKESNLEINSDGQISNLADKNISLSCNAGKIAVKFLDPLNAP